MNNRTRNVAMLAVMAAVIAAATLIDKLYSFGLVFVGGASLAVCSLVAVVTCALLYNNIIYAAASGAIMGVVSLVMAFIFPSLIFQNPLVSVAPRLFVGIIGFGAYRLARIAARGYVSLASRIRLYVAVPIALLAADITGLVLFLVFGSSEGAVFFLGLCGFVLAFLLIAGFVPACIAAKKGVGERGMEHFALGIGAAFTAISNTALVLPMMFLFGDQYSTLADVYAALTVINFLPELLVTTLLSPVVVLGVRRGLRLGTDGRPRVKAAKAPAPASAALSGQAVAAENIKENKEENEETEK